MTTPAADSRPLVGRFRASLARLARRRFDHRVVRWLQLGRDQQRWYLRKLFRCHPVGAVLDVGGNAGQYARFLRREVGYRGHIVTFEPIPALAAALKRESSGDPSWEILELALGDSPGQASFNVMNTSPMSSLLQPKADCSSPVMQFNRVSETVQVRVDTLDAVIAGHPWLRGMQDLYLKLDVQGYELKVLEGATRSLPRIAALQAELNVLPLYEGQPSYLEVMQYLDSRGYAPSLLPAHEYETFPEMIDFDAHFLRRDRMSELLRAARGSGQGTD